MHTKTQLAAKRDKSKCTEPMLSLTGITLRYPAARPGICRVFGDGGRVRQHAKSQWCVTLKHYLASLFRTPYELHIALITVVTNLSSLAKRVLRPNRIPLPCSKLRGSSWAREEVFVSKLHILE